MDVDEDIQPEDEENSIFVMSDTQDDDADQSMNSEDQQQLLNESFDPLDQRTNSPILPKKNKEILDNNEASPSITGVNFDGHFQTENIIIDKKGKESSRIGTCQQIEDIQMESSNISIPKLDEDSSHMSTDLKEGNENLSSDVSMSSERETQSPLIDNEISDMPLNNLKETEDNLNLISNISDVQLQNTENSQEENIQIRQAENSIVLDIDAQQEIENNPLDLNLKTDENEFLLEENSTENSNVFEITEDKVGESETDNKIINEELHLLSSEKNLSKIQVISDMSDCDYYKKENKNLEIVKNDSVQFSDVRVTNDPEISIYKENTITGNSTFLSNERNENLAAKEGHTDENFPEVQARQDGPEIKISTSKFETLQNEEWNREGKTMSEDKVSADNDTEIPNHNEDVNLSSPIVRNDNNVKTLSEPENLNLLIEPLVEGLTCGSDEHSSKNLAKVKENLTTEDILIPVSTHDEGNLLNSKSLSAIQKEIEQNSSNEITNFIEETKKINYLPNEENACLPSQSSDSICTIIGNEKHSENLTRGELALMMEEEIKDLDVSNDGSEYFTEVVKDIDTETKDMKILSVYSDIIPVTEDAKEIVMVSKPKEDRKSLKEYLSDNIDLVEKNSNSADKSLDNFTEAVVDPLGNEKVEITKISIQCSDSKSEAGRTVMDQEPDESSKDLGKLTDSCTNNLIKDVINEEVVKEAKCLEDCVDKKEIALKDDTPNKVKELDTFTNDQNKSLVDNNIKFSEICSNDSAEKTKKNVVIDVITLDECLDNVTEGIKDIVTDGEKANKSDSDHFDSDFDSDSNSYVDIYEYLMNMNKKDYVNSPDKISIDSLSYEYEEENREESTENNQSVANKNNKNIKAKTSSDISKKSQKTDIKVIKTEDNLDDKLTEALENSDTLELTSEKETHFKVIDEYKCEEKSQFEVSDEVGEEKKKKRTPISTEGLVNSSQRAFFKEPGKDMDDGPFTRVVIIGDSFVSQFIKMWPESSKIKPYFIYKDKVSFAKLLHFKIENHPYLKNSKRIFVLFVCGIHDISYYHSYKHINCRTSHNSYKIIRKLEDEPNFINHYYRSMITLKEKLEKSTGVFVAFSYLPVMDIKEISQSLSEFNRSKIINCICKFPFSKAKSIEGTNSIMNINRNIFHKHLNETKIIGIFEFCLMNVAFYLDRWCLYSKELKLNESSDVLNLSYLLDHVYSQEKKTKKNMPTSLFYKTNTFRILIIGDTWLKFVIESWDIKLDVKPFLYCKNGLTFSCIQNVITSLSRTGVNLLIIAAIPSGEFLTASKFPECKDHSSLEFLVPNPFVLKDPSIFAENILKKLDLLSLNVHNNKRCKIVFLTCYPSFFKNYLKTLYQKHIKSYPSHEGSKGLEELHDCSDFDAKIEICFKKINKHVVTLNKELGIPTCNIYSLIHKLATNDITIFPTEPKLSNTIQSKLFELLEKYICSFSTIFGAEDKNKKKEVSKKESLSEFISKSSNLCIKIENKTTEGNDSRSSSAESKRVIVLKKNKEKSPSLYEDLDSSHLKSKRKHTEELSTKSVNYKKDDNYDTQSRYRSLYSDRMNYSSRPVLEYNSKPSSLDNREQSPNRYEPPSKYSRRDHSRYTRSRSKERRHSTSRGKKYYASRSRSRSPTKKYGSLNRKRHRSKEQDSSKSRGIHRSRSRSRNRRSNSKRRYHKNRSRSPNRKIRSRSPNRKIRSRSPSRKSRSRSPNRKMRSRSPNRSCYKLESSRELNFVEKEAVASLWEAHSREREMYRKHPENHPDHDRVKRMWLDIMSSQGLNTFDASVLQCWWEYWLKKMEDLLESSWEEKKRNCLSLLSSRSKKSKHVSSDSSSSSSDSESRGSEKHSRKKKKKKFKSKKKARKHSPPKSKKDKSSHNDLPTSVEEIERLLQEFVKSNSERKNYEKISHQSSHVEKSQVYKPKVTKESEKMLDVISILCQIADKFGALGMSLTVLHEKAIECVKNGLSPYNCIDDDAKMLLELICDKIKKMLDHSDMTFVQRAIVQEAHDRLVPFLESFEKSKESNVDIEMWAKSTVGLQDSEVIDFIKRNLSYKGYKNLSNDQLMDIYLKIKSHQLTILDKKMKNMYDLSRPSTSSDLSTLGSFKSNSKNFSFDLQESFLSKSDKIKRNFLALTMHQKLEKFAMFHTLPYEEKSFLLSHLNKLEETEKELAIKIRFMIARNEPK